MKDDGVGCTTTRDVVMGDALRMRCCDDVQRWKTGVERRACLTQTGLRGNDAM